MRVKSMSLVERRYNEALDAMTGQERVERTATLFGSICEMLALQIRREHGDVDDRVVRVKTAERLYMSDKQTQRLLERVKLK